MSYYGNDVENYVNSLMHKSHKYIKKYKNKNGKWVYVYRNRLASLQDKYADKHKQKINISYERPNMGDFKGSTVYKIVDKNSDRLFTKTRNYWSDYIGLDSGKRYMDTLEITEEGKINQLINKGKIKVQKWLNGKSITLPF